MEFFTIIDNQVTEAQIQESIKPSTLDDFTETMFVLETISESEFKGVTLWGDFHISYHKIKGGVRFTLLDCPNALAWTITTGYPPERHKIAFHVTINRTQKHESFIEEIHEFMQEWEEGLKEGFD